MASKAAELRELNDGELHPAAGARRRKSTSTSASRTRPGQLDNSARIGDVRREIARLNTLLREREIAAAEAGAEEQQ